MSNVVTFKINDKDVSGRDDESILQVARENGIFIPTLCHLDGLGDIGACRLCLVEVKGSNKLIPACTAAPSSSAYSMPMADRGGSSAWASISWTTRCSPDSS